MPLGIWASDADFADQVKQIARQEILQTRNIIFGYISSYDPATQRARFVVPSYADDSNGYALTGWAPLASGFAGNGYGVQVGPMGGATTQEPTKGELCVIHYLDRSRGVIANASMVFNQQNVVPNKNLKAGEIYMKSGAGATHYLKNDGSFAIADKAGSAITLDGQGNIAIVPKGGKVFLGCAVGAGVPASMQGTITSDGAHDVSNLAQSVNVA